MKLLLPLLLIVLLQPSSPPSQKKSNEVGNKSQQNPKQQQAVAMPTPGQSPANTSDQDTQRTKDQGQNNEVKVSSLPREIEIKTLKDAIDKTVVGCTIVLTIVGIAGTIVAVKTLSEIKRQADILNEHKTKFDELAKAAARNAIAARRNAAFSKVNARAAMDNAVAAKSLADTSQRSFETIISKDRARLWVEQLSRPNLSVDSPVIINYKIHYEGSTPAYGVETEVNAVIVESKDSPLNDFIKDVVSELPSVVSAKDVRSVYMSRIVKMGPSIRLRIDGETLARVLSGEWVIHFYGRIQYSDFSGQTRTTTFRYRWIMGATESLEQWEQYGKPEDNQQT